MPNGGPRDYWRKWGGTRGTLGEPGSSTRGSAWLLEEMGRNKKNTGGSQGMPNGVRLSAGGNGAEQEEQWGRGTANTGGNQHKTGWGGGNAKRGFA